MTGFFVCDSCGCVDNAEITDPTNQWLCTLCQGKNWHGLFELRVYDPEQDLVINRPDGIGLG